MKVNLVLEAKLADVVASSGASAGSRRVPYCVWVVLGEFEPSDDEDEFDLHPIQERQPDTDQYRPNENYLMGSISHEQLKRMIDCNRAVKLIGPFAESESCLAFVKKLKDLLEQLGHETLLLECCDY